MGRLGEFFQGYVDHSDRQRVTGEVLECSHSPDRRITQCAQRRIQKPATTMLVDCGGLLPRRSQERLRELRAKVPHQLNQIHRSMFPPRPGAVSDRRCSRDGPVPGRMGRLRPSLSHSRDVRSGLPGIVERRQRARVVHGLLGRIRLTVDSGVGSRPRGMSRNLTLMLYQQWCCSGECPRLVVRDRANAAVSLPRRALPANAHAGHLLEKRQ